MLFGSKTPSNIWRRWVSDNITALLATTVTADADIDALEAESLGLVGSATTTSGTTALISGIPAGTQAIKIVLTSVASSGGTGDFVVTLGDSGGLEATGYGSATARLTASSTDTNTSTTGFFIRRTNTADVYSGVIEGVHLGSNLWVLSGTLADPTPRSVITTMGGEKTLSGELTQIELSVGTTFSGGSFSVFATG